MRYLNNIKQALPLLLLFCMAFSALPIAAQESADEVIFRAMRDEMQRTQDELSLPELPGPFFTAYVAGYSREFRVAGVLGGIIESDKRSHEVAGIEMFIGNYYRTSNINSENNIVHGIPLPMVPNYDAIRRQFWLGSDMAYRVALRSASIKASALKERPLSQEELELPDRERITLVERVEDGEEFIIDLPMLERLAKETSAVFVGHREIFNSMVKISGMQKDVYRLTSEGVVLKQPISVVTFMATALIITPERVSISNSFSLVFDNPLSLPSIEELKKKVADFIKELILLREAPLVDEFYTGPVLFEGGACFNILASTLLGKGALIAFRPPLDRLPALLVNALVSG